MLVRAIGPEPGTGARAAGGLWIASAAGRASRRTGQDG
jgi:hypothetical protein